MLLEAVMNVIACDERRRTYQVSATPSPWEPVFPG